jgi:hypothetical protein
MSHEEIRKVRQTIRYLRTLRYFRLGVLRRRWRWLPFEGPRAISHQAERHNEEVPRARDDGQACMRHVTAEDDGRACGRRECERGREPVLLVVFMERLALDDFVVRLHPGFAAVLVRGS